MINDADISENQFLHSYGEKVCMNLLKDHTTQQNIYWATDSYADYGENFTFFAPITLDKITSYASKEGKVITKEQYNELVKKNPEEKDNYQEIIRPRAVKSKEEQTQRAKDKAEVFTPAWICNAQNNLIDEEWFGRKEGLFNSPDPENPQKWINNEEKIEFPEGKTWKDYVADTRLEITCGEAPYLCNRYDAVTGEYNENVKYRIGMLDRKLRIVSENTKDSKDWILWAKIALRATYGFEWQGDNLLLAREALFFTFEEHYIAQFFDVCFSYIHKMEKYQNMLYKIAINKCYEELIKKLKSSALIDDELDALYTRFDRVFLNLYPTFVSDFNALLKDDEKIILKQDALLNRELRIYALLRLGITDSGKIANFLRCSTSTVYNYRTKMRNKAAVDRDEFENEIMKI